MGIYVGETIENAPPLVLSFKEVPGYAHLHSLYYNY
jgi:hypothetical protein